MALPLKGIHRPVGEISDMRVDDCFEMRAALYSSCSDKPLPVSPTHPSASPLLNVDISPVTIIERSLGGGAPPGWGKQDKRTKGYSEGWIQRTASTRWSDGPDGIIDSMDMNLRGPSPHSASILDPSCAARGQTSHSGVPSSLGVKERTCWLAWGPVGHSRGVHFANCDLDHLSTLLVAIFCG